MINFVFLPLPKKNDHDPCPNKNCLPPFRERCGSTRSAGRAWKQKLPTPFPRAMRLHAFSGEGVVFVGLFVYAAVVFVGLAAKVFFVGEKVGVLIGEGFTLRLSDSNRWWSCPRGSN